MSSNNGYIITPSMISLIVDSKEYAIPSSHVSYSEIKEHLLSDDPTQWDLLIELADSTKAVQQWGEGEITVEDGVLRWKGQVVHNVLTDKIIQGIRSGHNVKPFARFLSNLMENPSSSAIKELYLFLEKAQLPITDDGHFLAYKNVRENYTDRYSGRFDNRVGKVCEMPRHEVDDDRRNTCSSGLHFCALDYLKDMWGFSGKTMIVKINPADVVAIPYDYDNAKGRTWKYTVVGEVSSGKTLDKDFTDDVVWSDSDVEDWNDDYSRGWDDGYEVGYDDGSL